MVKNRLKLQGEIFESDTKKRWNRAKIFAWRKTNKSKQIQNNCTKNFPRKQKKKFYFTFFLLIFRFQFY